MYRPLYLPVLGGTYSVHRHKAPPVGSSTRYLPRRYIGTIVPPVTTKTTYLHHALLYCLRPLSLDKGFLLSPFPFHDHHEIESAQVIAQRWTTFRAPAARQTAEPLRRPRSMSFSPSDGFAAGTTNDGAGIDELPIFHVERVEMNFSVSAEFVSAQVANNVLILALSNGRILRIDLKRPQDIDGTRLKVWEE